MNRPLAHRVRNISATPLKRVIAAAKRQPDLGVSDPRSYRLVRGGLGPRFRLVRSGGARVRPRLFLRRALQLVEGLRSGGHPQHARGSERPQRPRRRLGRRRRPRPRPERRGRVAPGRPRFLRRLDRRPPLLRADPTGPGASSTPSSPPGSSRARSSASPCSSFRSPMTAGSSSPAPESPGLSTCRAATRPGSRSRPPRATRTAPPAIATPTGSAESSWPVRTAAGTTLGTASSFRIRGSACAATAPPRSALPRPEPAPTLVTLLRTATARCGVV